MRLAIILLCIFVLHAQAFQQRGYEIRDLYETDLALFQKEVEKWVVFEPASEKSITRVPATHNTSSQFILGGPNFLKVFNPMEDEDGTKASQIPYFRRVYTGLPPHQSLTITGKFWYFGYPRGNIGFSVTIFVNQLMFSPGLLSENVERPILNIGSEIDEISESKFSLHTLKYQTAGSGELLDLRVYLPMGNLIFENITFGFRDLTIHFSNSTVFDNQYSISSCPAEVIKSKSKRPPIGPCSCPLNQALDENEVCQNCSPNCEICLDLNPEQCLSCSPGSHWTGLECTACHWNCRTCTGPTQHECSVCAFGFYNYGNSSCLETCEWPLKPIWVGDELQCAQACPGEYAWSHLLENQCIKECEPPLIKVASEDNAIICETPCSDMRDYIYTNGSCSSTCQSPLLAEFNNGIKFCKNPCGGTSQYLYWNRSCLESCPAPLQVRSEPLVKYCLNPCSNPQLYLYNNGSCHLTCRFPLKVKIDSAGIKYCLTPCDLEREYILKDGSCSEECPVPLMKKIEPGVGTYCLSPCESEDYFVLRNEKGSSSTLCLLSCPGFFEVETKYGVKYCLNPCSSDQYYFEKNKTCLDACPYPLKASSEAVANFCQNPCSGSDDFIYDDQSCHKACIAPLVNLTESGGLNYCKSPCGLENKKYLIGDGSCQESCEYPYKIIKKGPYEICQIDVSKSQVHQVDSMRHTVKVSNIINEVGGLLGCLINAGDPTSIFMMPLLYMLEIIKYTEITLPVNIGLVLNKDQNMRILEETTSELDDLGDTFDHDLFIMGMVCLLILLLLEVKALIKPRSGSIMALILEQSTVALQWNVSASVLISINGDALLYLLAVFKYSQLDEIYKSLRILICLAVPLLTIFIVYKIVNISSEVKSIRERHLNEGQEQYLEASLSGLQRWKFIFEIYKSERPSQRLFVLIYILRVVLVNLTISCFSQYPLGQAIFIVSMSFGMLLYLIWASPIQKTSSYIQHIAIEISLLLYNVLFVILAVQESDQNLGVIGQLMMLLYLITPITTAIIILIKLLMRVYYLSRRYGSSSGSPSAGGIIQLGETSNRTREGDGEGEMSFNQGEENIVEVVSFETTGN